MKTISTLAIVGLVMMLLVGSANAAVSATSGAVVRVDPPSSIVLGAYQSNTEIRVFDEVQNLLLASSLTVDILASNATLGSVIGAPYSGKFGTIGEGTLVNSHLVHADPVGTQTINLTGRVTFNEPILGIILLTAGLDRTDSLLGNSGTTYATNAARGFDSPDTVTFIDAYTIEVKVNTSPYTDQLRVITQAPPAPPARTILGFYQPVEMNGVLNTVKGGSTVPMKFEVFEGETEITDVSQVTISQPLPIPCPNSAEQAPVEETTTDLTSLRYDVDGGQFIYNWKTPKTSGSCYRVTASSGSASIVAYFLLK